MRGERSRRRPGGPDGWARWWRPRAGPGRRGRRGGRSRRSDPRAGHRRGLGALPGTGAGRGGGTGTTGRAMIGVGAAVVAASGGVAGSGVGAPWRGFADGLGVVAGGAPGVAVAGVATRASCARMAEKPVAGAALGLPGEAAGGAAAVGGGAAVADKGFPVVWPWCWGNECKGRARIGRPGSALDPCWGLRPQTPATGGNGGPGERGLGPTGPSGSRAEPWPSVLPGTYSPAETACPRRLEHGCHIQSAPRGRGMVPAMGGASQVAALMKR